MCAEANGTRVTAGAYSIPGTCVRNWRKLKGRILLSKSTHKGFHQLQAGRFQGFEDGSLTADQMPVTTEVLKVKTLDLARHCDLLRSLTETGYPNL